MAENTPMMQQYRQIKAQNPDCILFFRLGDFYEMFAEDARLVSQELDLTLTTRDRGKEKEDQTPMCGVPFHSSESYIARLVARGYKVAICEQMEDPAKAKGLVKREVIRLITPGTVTDDAMLHRDQNNYFACVFAQEGDWAVAFCDVSTGAFCATAASGEGALSHILDELGRFTPAEVLLGGEAKTAQPLLDELRDRLACCVDLGADELFEAQRARAETAAQFPAEDCADLEEGILRTCGALLSALKQTQKTDLGHIRHLEVYRSGRYLELDLTARRNLELTETLRSKEKRGSLLWVLDHTRTAAGGRLLRSWLVQPLRAPAAIERRLGAVEELVRDPIARSELRELLGDVTDFERLLSRISGGTAGGRDLRSLANGCQNLPALRDQLARLSAPLWQELTAQLDPLEDLRAEIDRAIVDEPPFTIREGGILRSGYSEELDRLRGIQTGGKDLLSGIEAAEREKTGISKLKVGYNSVFGYYIEVSKSYTGQVPDNYIRKQTLTNCERYITSELKELESTILGAGEQITALEYSLFQELRERIAAQAARILATAQAVAAADVLADLAHVAAKNRYCRPEVDASGRIEISEGRHPVVEQVLKDQLFVPNDAALGGPHGHVDIITGPNMAGKSTFMRQVALIVLLAQMGSFVPAKAARIGVVDRIFTRIGASDDLASGQSTFMVEMSEVAEILRAATPDSLLILDEIGRGTSTFDGMAIARAVLEYAADRKKLGAKTLFATHYHELTELADEEKGIQNYNIAVKKRGTDVIFLRKIVPGAADDSFGVEVARLAGLPESVIRRARVLLQELEAGAPERPAQHGPEAEPQLGMEDLSLRQIADRLRALSVETMTPIEAMTELYQLKKLLG